MVDSLLSKLHERLEWFLSFGTESASSEDLLLIRRARGFGLIGLVIVAMITCVAAFTIDALLVAAGAAAMLTTIAITLSLSFVREARFTRLFAHVGVGAMLAGIFATSIHTGQVAHTSAIFPIVLILVTCYVLGVRAAVGWTLVAIGGVAFETFTTEVEAMGSTTAEAARVGIFGIRSIAFLGVMALAAVERRFADTKTEQLEFLARHDDLTGLCNRRAFEERASEALARASRHERNLAVLVIDLDGFKSINDVYGHAAGDEVLRAVGERIARLTRSTDSAGRAGGDEFMVLLEDVHEEKDVVLYAERLVSAICAPIRIGANELHVGASIGIAIAPAAGDEPEQLTRSADIAMFAAKNAGGSRVHVFEGAAPSTPGDFAADVLSS